MRIAWWTGLILVALTGSLVGCRPVVDPRAACLFDEECAADEICNAGRCEEEIGCEPDLLNNDSAETPLAGAQGRGLIAGRVCPGVSEFFSVDGTAGDPVHAFLRWTANSGANLDVFLIDGGTAVPLGVDADNENELGGGTLTGAGPFLIEVRPINVGVLGVAYELTLKTGDLCFTDSECVGDACTLPLFTPNNPNGNGPPDELIFVEGVCGLPRPPNCVAPDTLEGASSQGAPAFIPPSSSSCRDDEDWYAQTLGFGGDFIIELRHNSTAAGTYVVQMYDDAGNLLMARGFAGMPPGIDRAMSVPLFAPGRVLIRVTQLHDEETTYTLTTDFNANTCVIDGECNVAGIAEYGRTSCVDAGCACPAARCAP